MRRGNIRIGAHVEVEQRALCTLEQHLLAGLDSIIGHNGGVAHHRTQTVCVNLVLCDNSVRVDRLAAVNAGNHAVLAGTGLADNLLETLCVYKIVHADAAALGLVHVGRADALLGGADRGAFLGLLCLAERIQLKVPRHDAVAACVDEQLVGGNALLVQAVDLAEDSLRIDNNTRADDVDALRIQDAGRNQLQLVLLTAGYNGVTGIVAALAADNQIRLACENINKLTLAFVAPLGAENYLTWH